MIILWLVLGVVVWLLFEAMLAVVSYSQLDETEDCRQRCGPSSLMQ